MRKSQIVETPHGSVEIPTGLLIGGEWVDAENRKQFEVFNPSTGLALVSIADASPKDAVRALDAADGAQESWGKTSTRHRSTILRKIADGLREHASSFSWIISAELGKPVREAEGEVEGSAQIFDFLADQVTQQRGTYSTPPNGGFRIITTHEPIGPSYLVTPWNFPLLMSARKVGAALAAGCSVILKPAAQTPTTSQLFGHIMMEAGVPEGVVNVIPTSSASKQSSELMTDRRLRKVSFTGSTQVGSHLLKLAAPNVIATSMELGGNGPFIVLEGADLKKAAEDAVIAKYRNAGQVCVAANRIIVEKSIEEEFTARFVAAVNELKVGPAHDPSVDIGPLASESQVRDVRELVEQAVAEGAELISEVTVTEDSGYFYPPQVLAGASREFRIASEEIFGPVAVVYSAESAEDAIQFANATEYGLVGYIYSEDVGMALKCAEELKTGIVAINRPVVAEPAAPFGGIKASGLGKEGGEGGIREFQNEKYIALAL